MKKILTFFKGDAKKVINIALLLAFAAIFVSADMTEQNRYSSSSLSPEWNQFATVSQQESLTVGTPVQGEPGITETVQEIMEREAKLPADQYPKAAPRANPNIKVEPKSQDPD